MHLTRARSHLSGELQSQVFRVELTKVIPDVSWAWDNLTFCMREPLLRKRRLGLRCSVALV